MGWMLRAARAAAVLGTAGCATTDAVILRDPVTGATVECPGDPHVMMETGPSAARRQACLSACVARGFVQVGAGGGGGGRPTAASCT